MRNPNPRSNQSEQGTPRTSHDGRVIRGALPSLVRQQAPLYKAAGYRNLIGLFAARGATVKPIIRMAGYGGELPMTQQPQLRKPNPWSDPTRGKA